MKQIIKLLATAVLATLSYSAMATTDTNRPNILLIWGDDIGISNISAYSDGLMGYQTPNIDRLAKEGIKFTDYYGDQSCTAGRSTFLTGQSGLRTGLTKVGLPGADMGIHERDITMATIFKSKGYMTGQFGKNHFGDQDKHLPTNHGFDEFFGNLYHLNAEEEPEHPDYPKDPAFKKRFGPRGVIHSFSDGKIEDTGPLTKKRMEHVDEEFEARTIKFMEKAHQSKKPFFVWLNTTGMHFRTHPDAKHLGKSGQGFYNDVMVAHDELVGRVLDKLDDLEITNNTIVMYSTDNGVHFNTWPDAGITPFRSEKNSNWEGAYRVPAFVRWPGKISAGVTSNEIMSHLDWMPTLVAATGDTTLKKDLLAGNRTYKGKKAKLHLDGYNFLPYLTGEVKEGPRKVFHYLNDEALPVGVRVGDWKIVFAENRGKQMGVWSEPFVMLRLPKIFNLRRDPFERADDNSNMYWEWVIDRAPYIYLGLGETAKFLQTFIAYPPSQRADSWSVEKLTDKILSQVKIEEEK